MSVLEWGTSIADAPGNLAYEGIALHQNYPNPFTEQTTLAYGLHRAGQVTISVYDVLGRKVSTVVDQVQEPGQTHGTL